MVPSVSLGFCWFLLSFVVSAAQKACIVFEVTEVWDVQAENAGLCHCELCCRFSVGLVQPVAYTEVKTAMQFSTLPADLSGWYNPLPPPHHQPTPNSPCTMVIVTFYSRNRAFIFLLSCLQTLDLLHVTYSSNVAGVTLGFSLRHPSTQGGILRGPQKVRCGLCVAVLVHWPVPLDHTPVGNAFKHELGGVG